MKITNELLAAYAEGNVTPEERKVVRRYLVDHPSELESVMFMMDSDNDFDVAPQRKEVSFKGRAKDYAPETESAPPSIGAKIASGVAGCLAQHGIFLGAAAFAVPPAAHFCSSMDTTSDCMAEPSSPPQTFDERLDELLDEVF